MSTEMINNFIQKREEEEKALTLQFAKAILSLQLDKKEIDKDIKLIKEDAKANGVLVKNVNSGINLLKKELKEDKSDLNETDRMFSILSEDEEVKSLIMRLVEK